MRRRRVFIGYTGGMIRICGSLAFNVDYPKFDQSRQRRFLGNITIRRKQQNFKSVLLLIMCFISGPRKSHSSIRKRVKNNLPYNYFRCIYPIRVKWRDNKFQKCSPVNFVIRCVIHFSLSPTRNKKSAKVRCL